MGPMLGPARLMMAMRSRVELDGLAVAGPRIAQADLA